MDRINAALYSASWVPVKELNVGDEIGTSINIYTGKTTWQTITDIKTTGKGLYFIFTENGMTSYPGHISLERKNPNAPYWQMVEGK